jgi:hypothetical protein
MAIERIAARGQLGGAAALLIALEREFDSARRALLALLAPV